VAEKAVMEMFLQAGSTGNHFLFLLVAVHVLFYHDGST
jgi:hypothetical protein